MKRALTMTLLLLVLSSFSFAQGLGLHSITAKGGVMLPETPWDTGFQLGAKADLGEIFENARLNPVIEYWNFGYSVTGFDYDLTNIQIGAELHYAIASVKGLYVGGGLVLNMVSWDIPTVSFGGFSSGGGSVSNTDFGATALAGLEFPLGGMTGVAEAKYNITDLSAIGITFGVKFDMSK